MGGTEGVSKRWRLGEMKSKRDRGREGQRLEVIERGRD